MNSLLVRRHRPPFRFRPVTYRRRWLRTEGRVGVRNSETRVEAQRSVAHCLHSRPRVDVYFYFDVPDEKVFKSIRSCVQSSRNVVGILSHYSLSLVDVQGELVSYEYRNHTSPNLPMSGYIGEPRTPERTTDTTNHHHHRRGPVDTPRRGSRPTPQSKIPSRPSDRGAVETTRP